MNPVAFDANTSKQSLLQKLTSHLEKVLARSLDENELHSLAFLIDRKFDSQANEDVFFTVLLKQLTHLTPDKILSRINELLYQTLNQELKRRLHLETVHSEQYKKLVAIQTLMDHVYTDTSSFLSSTIGTVPSYWLPQWVTL